MPVKHWSSAGLLLTDRCNASCASCYLRCSPSQTGLITADNAIRWWTQLDAAAPNGCKVHIAGGEPMLYPELLLEILHRAADAGCSPAVKIETNGFWANDPVAARELLHQLKETSMRLLLISADPFHQEFVPIATVQRAAEMAREILGPGRVRVRWEDWIASGVDVQSLDKSQRESLFASWITEKRDRLNGRAAVALAHHLPTYPAAHFAGHLTADSCREWLLRGKHVHVGPDGWTYLGTCAGISVGTLDASTTVADLWSNLQSGHAEDPILGPICKQGPAGLCELARAHGIDPDAQQYASKCHLCYSLRTALARTDLFPTLAPSWVYAR